MVDFSPGMGSGRWAKRVAFATRTAWVSGGERVMGQVGAGRPPAGSVDLQVREASHRSASSSPPSHRTKHDSCVPPAGIEPATHGLGNGVKNPSNCISAPSSKAEINTRTARNGGGDADASYGNCKLSLGGGRAPTTACWECLPPPLDRSDECFREDLRREFGGPHQGPSVYPGEVGGGPGGFCDGLPSPAGSGRSRLAPAGLGQQAVVVAGPRHPPSSGRVADVEVRRNRLGRSPSVVSVAVDQGDFLEVLLPEMRRPGAVVLRLKGSKSPIRRPEEHR